MELGFVVVRYRRRPQILLVEARLDVKIGLVRVGGAESTLFAFPLLPLMDLFLQHGVSTAH